MATPPDLREYERKRDFAVTSEPGPGSDTKSAAGKPTFMVHKHDATRLHYDLRLEMDGALASWAVPKGPSYDPAQKRLAVQTEDHPLEYGSFEGRIPEGEYGAGDSLIWDRGTYDTVPPGEASQQRKKGRLKLVLDGQKLKGLWHLIRTRGGDPDKPQAPGPHQRADAGGAGGRARSARGGEWLLFKGKDEVADSDYDVIAERPESVVSGRATTRGPARRGGEKVWPTVREDKMSAEAKRESAEPEVKLTSPDKVIYPRDGLTKADVAAYFEAMAEPLLRALRDRPLALEHFPKGIDEPSWFHQNIGKEAQPWMRLVETPARTSGRMVRHLIVDRPAALRWLAQRSAIHIHMWSSREPTLTSPDWVVFDFDPADGKGFEQTIEPALALKRLLDEQSLPSVPKTSGRRGLHVLVPLKPGHTHDDALAFAEKIGAAIAGTLPDVTMERSKSKRLGRLYLDCYQNGYGKTIIAPYSLRAADGAPVSAPVTWAEIEKGGLDPKALNLRSMPARLATVGDLFRPALEAGVRLPQLR